MTTTASNDPGRLSLLRNAVRAVVGLPCFVVAHARRETHIEHTDTTVDQLSEQPPEPTTVPGLHDPIQHRTVGVGPVVMRTYSVDITNPALTRHELIAALCANPNRFNSDLVAGFVQDDQPATDLTEGDQLVVEIPGPWNGPVHVAEANVDRLLLATMNGHMEAGHIRFDTAPLDESAAGGGYQFRIRSWATAGDAAFLAAHLVVPVGKAFQTAMWTAMCDNAESIAGGTRSGSIRVSTEKVRTR